VLHLIRDILPLVWARDPGITCRIIGHGWDAARLPGVDPRIEVLGAVDDLDAVLGQARLSVAPLRFGAGLKGKVLDSLAAGLPCVMTPIAAEGLELTGPLAGLVGADAPALAELILRLHADRDANEQIGALGRRMMAEGFCQEAVTSKLAHALGDKTRDCENSSIPIPMACVAS
jgi:glycosyltransferase involved in cell wall biosynthesis